MVTRNGAARQPIQASKQSHKLSSRAVGAHQAGVILAVNLLEVDATLTASTQQRDRGHGGSPTISFSLATRKEKIFFNEERQSPPISLK